MTDKNLENFYRPFFQKSVFRKKKLFQLFESFVIIREKSAYEREDLPCLEDARTGDASRELIPL